MPRKKKKPWQRGQIEGAPGEVYDPTSLFNNFLSRHVSFNCHSKSASCLNQNKRLQRSLNNNGVLYCCLCPSNDGGLFRPIIIFLHSLMYDFYNSDGNIGVVLIVSVALSGIPIIVHGSSLLAGPMMPSLLLPLFWWVLILLLSVLVAMQVTTCGIVGQRRAAMVRRFMHLEDNVGLWCLIIISLCFIDSRDIAQHQQRWQWHCGRLNYGSQFIWWQCCLLWIVFAHFFGIAHSLSGDGLPLTTD